MIASRDSKLRAKRARPDSLFKFAAAVAALFAFAAGSFVLGWAAYG